MPRGTTQVVTRGASNDWCQTVQVQVRGGSASVRGTVAVRGVSTRQYERQYEVGVCQSCAIMRRLVECKMTKIPLDPAI
ncbi:hypothetical protein Tco_0120174 [Tanacetum coccineum]